MLQQFRCEAAAPAPLPPPPRASGTGEQGLPLQTQLLRLTYGWEKRGSLNIPEKNNFCLEKPASLFWGFFLDPNTCLISEICFNLKASRLQLNCATEIRCKDNLEYSKPLSQRQSPSPWLEYCF